MDAGSLHYLIGEKTSKEMEVKVFDPITMKTYSITDLVVDPPSDVSGKITTYLLITADPEETAEDEEDTDELLKDL